MATIFVQKNKGSSIMGNLGLTPNKFYGNTMISRKNFDGFDIADTDIESVKKLLDDEKIKYQVVTTEMNLSVSGGKLLSAGQEIDDTKAKVLSKTVMSFLDTIGTSLGRATHYNTKAEQEAATNAIHNELFKYDRGLYALLLCLEGVTDNSKQIGMRNLLDNSRQSDALVDNTQERTLITHLLQATPVTRVLKMYNSFTVKGKRVNNARTKKLALSYLLSSDSLEWWSVKYRRKIRAILTHSWGQSMATAMKSILAKSVHDAKEKKILAKSIDKFIGTNNKDRVYECVSFILGNEIKATLQSDLIGSYIGAKRNWQEGKKLPYEVLEGIRSTYHKDLPNSKVLELTKGQLTEKQKMQFQSKAKREGVTEVKFDPTKQNMIDMMIHMYQTGYDADVAKAFEDKAANISKTFPVKYGKVGIVLDASGSMFGHETQKLRPLATAIALKSVLANTGNENVVKVTGGVMKDNLIFPGHETDIASALLDVLEENPDIVYIITDGYENQPAGRTNEVMIAMDKIGVNIPVQQVTPVMAAESDGIKKLSAEFIPTMPVNNPESMGVGMLKSALLSSPREGILALINSANEKVRLQIEV